jgi:hypothetical protein
VDELSRRFGETAARIEVTLDGVRDDAAREHANATLKAVPGVSRVLEPERARDPWTLLAPHDQAMDVRVATLAAAASEGLGLSAIREIEPSLDDIYRRALKDRSLVGEAA